MPTPLSILDGVGPGQLIGERFVLEARAGAGGMGEVWRAREGASGRPVAVKLLLSHRASALERFAWEAKLLAEIDHPGIVRYIAHGLVPAGQMYLAMEWLDGCDLRAALERGPLGVDATMELAVRAADALAAIHAHRVLHRDVKPSNLFLVGGRVDGVKLIDFGLARLLDPAWSLTRTGMILGTPGYAAPEQVDGAELDPSADVFALGCVLYVCLSGRMPFVGSSAESVHDKVLLDEPPALGELVTALPPALAELVMTCLSKDPDERPADGRELALRLRGIGVRSGEASGATTTPAAAREPPTREKPAERAPTEVRGGSGGLRGGFTLAGRYRAERLLGRGGMGSLWVATDTHLDREVAVKVLAEHLVRSESSRARFRAEATAAARLRSHHVVQVHDHGIDGERPYIVMELLEGEDLGRRIERTGRLTLPEAARVLAQATKALGVAHEAGVIHRDIKPTNIFLARVPGETEETVKLLDFGVAKTAGPRSPSLTDTGAVVGALPFMSPQQLRSGQPVGPSADLWSLAVTLYLGLTGRLPFTGDVPRIMLAIAHDPVPAASAHASDLPAALDGFFARALAKDPAQRFATARDLGRAFEAAIGLASGSAGQARPLAAEGKATRPAAMDEALATTELVTPLRVATDGASVLPARLQHAIAVGVRRHRLSAALLAVTVVSGVVVLGRGLGAERLLVCIGSVGPAAGGIARELARAQGEAPLEAPEAVERAAASVEVPGRAAPAGAAADAVRSRPRKAPSTKGIFGY
jgi:serine/threonine-protein kinase